MVMCYEDIRRGVELWWWTWNMRGVILTSSVTALKLPRVVRVEVCVPPVRLPGLAV